ncbi:MAG: TetR/AcrR family transcriptional regulator [Ramlibacter sp.]|nr:TetR/AcrR family transcriptional regulator [Ramlibacter sp.]
MKGITVKLAPSPERRVRKLSDVALQARAQKTARVREQMMTSAARVVGEYGYRDASVQRITAAAGLAQGTFYLYFASRQALFDELLPHFGLAMLEAVRVRSEGTHGFFDLEEIGMKAVVEYLVENPWFWRLLNEAEVEAPLAWQRHHDEVTRRYVRFLKRARLGGELKGYSEKELGTLAQLLIAARDYIYRSHLTSHDPEKKVPAALIKTYRKFIEKGLAGEVSRERP